MSQVITGVSSIPISAASAGYAPTNTGEVGDMIGSAVSGLASTADLSAYLATSSIGVDSASAITSIAGSSIAGGGGIDNLYGATGSSGGQRVRLGGNNTSDLGNTAATGAGLFLNNPTYGTAYYKVNELVLNRGGTARIDFNLSTGGAKVNITSTKGGYVTVSGTGSSSSASISMSATTSRATLKFSDSYATGQIYSTSIGYWNDKLDASASSAFITSTADCMPLSASSNYQTTAGMSAYASTSDLSAKLDSSAIQYVSASADATASGVVYIVTGTGAQ